MAQYRQSGADRFSASGRGPHDQHHATNGAAAASISASADQIAVRIPHHKQVKIRRSGRSDKNRRIPIGSVILILALTLCVSVFAFNYISASGKEDDRFDEKDDDQKKDVDFQLNATRTKESKVLKFGRGSVSVGRDSRYWDRDDRRRDGEYDEDASGGTDSDDADSSAGKDHKVWSLSGGKPHPLVRAQQKSNDKENGNQRNTGLYNEAGRDELKIYEAEFEASLKKIGQSGEENGDGSQEEEAVLDDEYGDGIDSEDDWMEELNDTKNDNVDDAAEMKDTDGDAGEALDATEVKDRVGDSGEPLEATEMKDMDGDSRESLDDRDGGKGDSSSSNKAEDIHADMTNTDMNTMRRSDVEDQSTKRSRSGKKDIRRRGKHHRFSGSSCDMKFLESTAQLVEPIESKRFSRFSLQYTKVEEQPEGDQSWQPRFAGHQNLQEREESFYAHDQKINCGFIKGPMGSPTTGFDLAEDDVRFMSSCHIAVSSCIFGNSDNLRTPTNKVVTRSSRKNVCFVLFMDETTMQTLRSEGHELDRGGFIGLWKIVVIKNLPYTDMRRVGKIPKFLTHRLFPSARYSIWLDSKLRLQSDPLLILEYFLWRKGYEYAISNHYDRHCVWEEVMQNKRLNKYNHTVIDQQFAFYRADGLKRFNASDPNRFLPSYVPEGSFIVRAHTPMSNLFSCLWFNEVDRFTPRDQLSFAYTYLKLRRMNPGKTFHLNMFKDCERRSIAKLFRHRTEMRNGQLQAAG